MECGSVVIISTLGCKNRTDEFLKGFDEMRARIDPPLIIVIGNMIKGMTGTFLNYRYNESFSYKHQYEQMRLEGLSKVFTIKEAA